MYYWIYMAIVALLLSVKPFMKEYNKESWLYQELEAPTDFAYIALCLLFPISAIGFTMHLGCVAAIRLPGAFGAYLRERRIQQQLPKAVAKEIKQLK